MRKRSQKKIILLFTLGSFVGLLQAFLFVNEYYWQCGVVDFLGNLITSLNNKKYKTW